MIDPSGRACTSLVTGASAGIGRALALELARRGSALVLVARRRERLEQVAAECRTVGAPNVEIVVLDLGNPSAPLELVRELERRGVSVDVLINNAGFGQARRFQESTWEQHRVFLQVMLLGVVELTHHLVPPMVERGFGRVLHVASLAHQLPGTPGDTLYAPTKSFLVKLAQGQAAELGHTGVRVCALCPGYTYSEFHDVSGTRAKVKRLPEWMWLDAESVAREGVGALLAGSVVCYPGRFNRVAHGLLAGLPDRALQRLWSRRPTRR